jgi:hypothetical protein
MTIHQSKTMRLVSSFVLGALMWAGVPVAQAQEVDPELFFISSSATTFCTAGGACVLNNEVNPLGSGTVFVDFNSDGKAHTAVNPVLLIIGIPGTVTTAPTISTTLSTGGTARLDGGDIFGGNWNSTGLKTGCNSTTCGGPYDAFEYLGLKDGSSSESYTNWVSVDSAVGAGSPTSYTLAIYELFPSTHFSAGNDIGVSFASGLALGDLIVAYGCSRNESPCAVKDLFSTPFTQAGVVTPAAEPPAVALSAIVLLAFAAAVGAARRKRVT